MSISVQDYKGRGVTHHTLEIRDGFEIVRYCLPAKFTWAGLDYSTTLGYVIYPCDGRSPIAGSPRALLTWEEVEQWFARLIHNK